MNLPKTDEIYKSRHYPEMRVIIQKIGTFRTENDTIYAFNTLEGKILAYCSSTFYQHYKKLE